MVCMVILFSFALLLKGRVNLFFGVFWHIYIREDNQIFFQKNHIGQSYINSSENRIKSTTISE